VNGTTELVLSERRRGFALALLANLVWGTAAIYWMQTQPVTPVDVLAHRSIWDPARRFSGALVYPEDRDDLAFAD